MRYVAGAIPPDAQPWVVREVRSLEQTIGSAQELMQLKVLHVQPAKPRDGMIVCADGTDWNPGAGAGFYGRLGGAWAKF